MPTAVERKLTTILCADIEGYSRLMDRRRTTSKSQPSSGHCDVRTDMVR